MEKHQTTVVVFGGTGDLFQNKLAGAFFDLWKARLLPAPLRIIGISRKNLTDEEFRSYVKSAIVKKKPDVAAGDLDSFLPHFLYQRGDINERESYARLGAALGALDEKDGRCSNKLFYLAVPPTLYRPIFENLAASGLTIPCAPGIAGEGLVWARVLAEKPFGSDPEEAKRLDRLLGSLFHEEQIFRIDHYLAKETLQNILTFRFSNSLFEPIWDAKHIERVDIRLFEKGVVGARGTSYDPVGALRDVGQNHLLVMLAMIAMEYPGALGPEAIRRKRAEVLKDAVFTGVPLRGQYDGYRREPGVAAGSDTETYFRVTLAIKNKRWKGVPFYLESGKGLAENVTEIVIRFREPEHCICPESEKKAGHSHRNTLTFRIRPSEGITVGFFAKRPGFDFALEPKLLSFDYEPSNERRRIPDAYERVLFDCIRGDQTLFASTKEVERQWDIIAPILRAWKKEPLHSYAVGSAGPASGRAAFA